ncbi:MAG: hypothetical protein ACPG4X_20215 [Pikeienuella sp.]
MFNVTSKMLKGAVAAATLLAASAQMASATNLTMSSWLPPTHFGHTDFLKPYADKIAEVTNGRVTVTILPAPLGSPPTALGTGAHGCCRHHLGQLYL